MKKYLPLMVNVRNKDVIIFGGGKVALRKAKKLLDLGARVSVVSNSFKKEFDRINVEKSYLKEKRQLSALLKGKVLAIAATNDKEFNLKVKEESEKLGIMCNVVDFRGSDVIFPAVFKKGDVIVAVSSSGNLPYFSEFLARKMGEMIKPYLEAYPALKRVRKSLKGVGPSKKKKIQEELLNNYLELLRSGQSKLIEEKVDELLRMFYNHV